MRNPLPNEGAANLAVVLERLVAELQTLASMTVEMQAEIAPLISQCPVENPSGMKALQSLDVVTQHLTALALFSNSVCQTVPTDMTIDNSAVVEQIGIEALAARLSGTTVASKVGDDTAGDCDFF